MAIKIIKPEHTITVNGQIYEYFSGHSTIGIAENVAFEAKQHKQLREYRIVKTFMTVEKVNQFVYVIYAH